MYGCLALTAALLALFGTLLHNSTEAYNMFLQQESSKFGSYPPNARILFLTAHPDDECMFFAPTIMALTSKMKFGLPASHSAEDLTIYPEVYLLCLSAGDADGLGAVRKEELGRSLDILGIRSEHRMVIDHPYVFYFIIFVGSWYDL
jgi:N-acetylglucosaminylphosphatidylinositol deacetylase